MLITCTECHKASNCLLDVKTNEVICQECGCSIRGLSKSMILCLKQNGQIVRNNERKGFMMACSSCHANREVVLDEKNNTICKICHEPIKVTPAFKLAMGAAGVKMEKVVVGNKVVDVVKDVGVVANPNPEPKPEVESKSKIRRLKEVAKVEEDKKE